MKLHLRYSTMVESVWERLQPELDSRIWGTQQLADALGVSYQAMRKVRDGSSFGTTNNLKAAKVLGLSPEWLATGRGEKHAHMLPNVSTGPDIKGKGRYPLISWVKAGEWTDVYDHFSPGDAEEWPSSHHNLGPAGYMLRVQGDSITAPPGSKYSFPSGVLLHIRPETDPVAGQFVIVRRSGENEATFKRLSLVDGELFLEAINPDRPRRHLPLKDGDVFCGVVVDASFGNLP